MANPFVHVELSSTDVNKAKDFYGKQTDVKDMGWFSIITDPTGAMLGLWQNKSG